MANRIVIKKSIVAGVRPAPGDLLEGELGVNVTDETLWGGVADPLLDPIRLNPTNVGGALGYALFDYRFATIGTVSPGNGRVSYLTPFVALGTVNTVYIHKNDASGGGGDDASFFWEELKAGDWLNLYDDSNYDERVSFDVTGPAVLNGDIFEVPVTEFESLPTLDPLTDGQRLKLLARIVTAAGGATDEITADIANATGVFIDDFNATAVDFTIAAADDYIFTYAGDSNYYRYIGLKPADRKSTR